MKSSSYEKSFRECETAIKVIGSRTMCSKLKSVCCLKPSSLFLCSVLFLLLCLEGAMAYYMFPENSAECGKSIFYTHREARLSSGTSHRRRGRELDFNGTYSGPTIQLWSQPVPPKSSKSRGRHRGSRVNSRVMKWALKNASSLNSNYDYSDNGDGPLGRIVGGQVSEPYAWPWQISLQLNHPTMGFVGHWCGGVLIGKEWALTAAHCVQNKMFRLGKGSSWYVLAGEYDRTKTEGTEKMIGISRIFIHERFKEFDNDIALLKLSRPIEFSPTIAPVCLPSDDETTLQTLQGKVKCISSGFGSQSAKGKLSSKMQQVWVNLTPQDKCDQLYQKAYRIGIRNFHICAGPADEKTVKGTCVGDSGGPLMCNMKDGRWHLVGVTSFGSGCARAGYPDVYSRITYYLPWIRGKIRRYGTPFVTV